MATTKASTAGPFTEDGDPDVKIRHQALELAIATFRQTSGSTTFQVVHTADLYAKFMQDGSLPPAPAVAEGDQVQRRNAPTEHVIVDADL